MRAEGKGLSMSSAFGTINKTPWDTITHRVLEIVAKAPGCEIAHVTQLLPDVTLREILYCLSDLKKSGHLHFVVGNKGAVLFTLSPRLFH